LVIYGGLALTRWLSGRQQDDDRRIYRTGRCGLVHSRRLALATVFQLEETRTVSNEWVVRYANRFLQLPRQSAHPPARSTVRVYEAADGQIEIRYRDRRMQWQEIPAGSVAAKDAQTPRGWQAPAKVTPTPTASRPPRGLARIIPGGAASMNERRNEGPPQPDHRDEPVEAAGAVDARSTRPPRCGKLPTVFHSSHRHESTRGHF
jgi:hypothetical protein